MAKSNKSTGKLLLLISGIILLIWAVFGLVGLIQSTPAVFKNLFGDRDQFANGLIALMQWLIRILLTIFELLAAIGGIAYYTGSKTFSKYIGPFAIINLVLSIAYGWGALTYWGFYVGLVVAILYFIGWLMAKAK
jgi:hypothetical protein